MPSRKIKRRRHHAIDALNALSSEVWAIDDSQFKRLVQSVFEMAESGRAPEASFAGGDYASSKIKLIGSVAVIPITGVITPKPNFWTKYYSGTACEDLRRDIATALGNSTIEKIILYVDSPGGSVLQLKETAAAIRAASETKTVEAYVVGMCASAAYHLASAASRIVAGPTTLSGSIGAKMTHVDASEYYAERGFKIEDIQFGKHKTDGSPYRPLDEQGRATFQEIVDDYGKIFVSDVAKYRGITTDVVMETFGQGKLFVAEKALAISMVDAIGTLEISDSQSEVAVTTPTTSAPSSNQNTVVTVETQSRGAVPHKAESENKVNKLKALIFGLGLTAAADVSDEVATVALNSFCAAKGVDSPVNADGKIDEAKAIGILKGTGASTETLVASVATIAPASNVQAAHDQEVAEAKAAAIKSYTERRDNIIAIAKLVNGTAGSNVIDTAKIDAAVADESKSTDAIRTEWTASLSSGPGGVTVPDGNVTLTSGEDVFAQSCVNALRQRAGRTLTAEENQQLRGAGRSAANLSFHQMAAKCLEFSGNANPSGMTPEAVLSLALQGDTRRIEFGASAPAYNRPGDFNFILSNLANLTLDENLELAKVTYDKFSEKLPDTNDFKPSTFLLVGSFTSMDVIPDGDPYKELQFDEELRGRISVDRYGNIVKLTPKMMVDDAAGLDAFMQQLKTLSYALENTINEANLMLITGNAMLADGKRLFDVGFGNDVVNGGVPSMGEARKMDLAHSFQTGVNTEKNIKSEPNLVLFPKTLKVPIVQTYAPLGLLQEAKQAEVDSQINIYRGSVGENLIMESDLDRASTQKWYTFDTMHRTITHQFQTGYGRGGKRETWFDMDTGCRKFSLEGRFGVSAMGRRGIVRNSGVPVIIEEEADGAGDAN